MKFEDKVYLADRIYWLFINKLEDNTDKMVVKQFVIDNPDDEGTINTELGSELYYEIEDTLDEID
mgnify:CR=1 FL=1|tara:strand:- start:186 stop:380 length:195 start_codon:yes stop_codon:yes gene_type:complete